MMSSLGTQISQFMRSTNPDERLKLLRYIGQEASLLRLKILEELVVSAIKDDDPRLRGEICYALGEAGIPEFIPVLEIARTDSDHWVSSQAASAIQKLAGIPPNTSEMSKENLGSAAKVLDELFRSILSTPKNNWTSYVLEVNAEFEQNHRAFERDQPKLMNEHKGEVAVYCDGRLIFLDVDEAQAIQDAVRLQPNRRLYVRKVGEELPTLGINTLRGSQESL